MKKLFSYNQKEVTNFTSRKEIIKNPLMGFAPLATDKEAVGDNTLVYAELTWREWEPEEGVYNTKGFEESNHLKDWKEQGKNGVLRFICDSPSAEEHLDIPDWLYEETGKDGKKYDTSYGKGYSPNYENELFIRKHAEAIKALGAYYGQDSFFCYIEVGSIGHWGEWHVNISEDEEIPNIPDSLMCQNYVIPYVNAFPHARLLMRRPYEWVSRLGLGVYNDMAGDEEETDLWLSWLERGEPFRDMAGGLELTKVPEIWKKSPVGGEFNSAVSMKEMLDDNLSTTLSLLEKSHMTFIGPKAPVNKDNGSGNIEAVNAVLDILGYRYEIIKSVISTSDNGDYLVELSWKNCGAAPIYWEWPVMLYIFNNEDEIIGRQIIDISLCQLYPQETTVSYTSIEKSLLENGTYRIGAGILNPATYEPAIQLGMESETIGKIAIVVKIKN